MLNIMATGLSTDDYLWMNGKYNTTIQSLRVKWWESQFLSLVY